MEKVNQVQYLQYHLRNLKIIKNHIIVHHLPNCSMMIIKNQKVRVLSNFLLGCHMRRNSAIISYAFSNGNAIETNQVRARVSLQLLNIEQKRLQFRG